MNVEITVNELIQKASSRRVVEFFSNALQEAKEFLNTGKIVKGQGLFGENREIVVLAILKNSAGGDKLQYANTVQEKLDLLFLGKISAVNTEQYLDAATLCLYGLLLGEFEEEDFRHIYRLSLISKLDRTAIENWLRKAITLIGISKGLHGRELLSEIREWIRFLGTPFWSPAKFQEPCDELGINIEDVLQEDDFRLVDTFRRHREYLEEALVDKPYCEVRKKTREWLPDTISSQIFDIYLKRNLGNVQNLIPEDTDILMAFKIVRDYFEKICFKTHDDHLIPVRLQDLPNPPPPSAIDPTIFEIIPKKLRKDLMPSVVYSVKPSRIELIFLGGPRIGHSGILIKTDSGGILLDFGLSVANQQIPQWEPELELIDSVLVSHAHLDHIGGLPILYEKYEGKWCSTGLTAAISRLLLEDAFTVGTPLPPRKRDKTDFISRFTKKNIEKVVKNYVPLEVEKSSEVGGGIVVTPINSSHIPGSVAFLIDIEGVKILYTGDFNLDDSFLYQGANLPTDPDIVIFDGTYWGREDFDRNRVLLQMHEIVRNHGPIIIPAFAAGRSQEMLVLLERIGATESRNVIVAGLSEKVTRMAGYSGGWESMKKNKVVLEKEDILVAGGGMMNGGLSKEHFEQHRDNPNAAIVLCGYLAPRTPGWNLLKGYEKHRCRVEYARLSAHSSASKLQEYVSKCQGKKYMVHTPAKQPPKGIHIPTLGERIEVPV